MQRRIVSFDELKPEFGIPWTRDHLRRKCDAGEFPAPIALSPARIGWFADEIEGWLAERAQHRGTLQMPEGRHRGASPEKPAQPTSPPRVVGVGASRRR